MELSCGILILNKTKEKILLGHSTNNSWWDIPKGRQNKNESYIETAIRECKEETSIEFLSKDLITLGFTEYTIRKNLCLFAYIGEEFDVNKLICTSYFDTENKRPEMDAFNYFNIKTELKLKTTKNMYNTLIKYLF